jgi:hypothetical protein
MNLKFVLKQKIKLEAINYCPFCSYIACAFAKTVPRAYIHPCSRAVLRCFGIQPATQAQSLKPQVSGGQNYLFRVRSAAGNGSLVGGAHEICV